MRVAFLRGTTLGMIEEGFISRLREGDRFVFAGRALELIRVRDMTAFVRPARQTSGSVVRWNGSKCPLSTLLSQAIRRKIDEARRGIFDSLEMERARPLLELQARWSRIPAPDEVLVERTRTREGYHLFIFPFEGRLVHEGLCSLVAHRVTQREPRSVQVTGNDYGFELQTRKPLHVDENILRQILTTDRLVEDLLACVNTTALARRQFREIARVAGLLFPGFPGQPKSMRQLQASSSLFYEVFEQFDPRNLLLDQAKREVLDRELEVTRMRATLERIERSRLVIVDVPRLTPLSFPLWADSLRTQQVTSESWSERVRRMVVELEAAADEDSSTREDSPPRTRRTRKADVVPNRA
jgi:ATP-dependent Lhr-like helicase